jgi:hypothetical protein
LREGGGVCLALLDFAGVTCDFSVLADFEIGVQVGRRRPC